MLPNAFVNDLHLPLRSSAQDHRTMATPRRIFRIYHALGQDAETVRDFQLAQGQKVSGTVNMLIAKDAGKLLAKWGEEMAELCGVLDGSHDDPYIMESTQTFYWGSLYAVVQGMDWETLGFDQLRRDAATCGITTVEELRNAVVRLVGVGPEGAKPGKLFLLWNVADGIYRRQTPASDQRSLTELMDYDLHDMRQRSYLAPLIDRIAD
jgi:phosphoribosyl-ATP pyrophosphohydrolase